MKHIPTRTCIVCREAKLKPELLRIVRRADGTFTVDTDGNAPGRGAYVCAGGDCRSKLISKHVLNRAYKQNIPQSQYDALAAMLADTENNGTE